MFSEKNEYKYRSALFLAIFFLILVGFIPFPRGDSTKVFSQDTGLDSFAFIVLIIIGVIIAKLIYLKEKTAFIVFYHPFYILLFVWILVTIPFAQDIIGSLKRLILFLICLTIYACVFLLPQSRKHMAFLLATSAYFVTILCYFGVIFLPFHAIHQASDSVEPHLAGNWRGLYDHKNGAGPVFASILFISIYLGSLKYIKAAIILGLLASLFLFKTEAKTANLSLIMTLISVPFALEIKLTWVRNIVLLTPFFFLSIIGVGQVLYSPIAQFVELLPIEPTFTGRTGIWAYTISNIEKFPIFGHGFWTFWDSEIVKVDRLDKSNEGVWAFYAHNGYLDVVLSIGIPGLIFFMLCAVVIPLLDIDAIQKRKNDYATLMFLTMTWQYFILIGTMESIFLQRLRPASWFLFVFALFGLRYMSRFSFKKE